MYWNKAHIEVFAEETPECSGPPMSDKAIHLLAKLYYSIKPASTTTTSILSYHNWHSFSTVVLEHDICGWYDMFLVWTICIGEHVYSRCQIL